MFSTIICIFTVYGVGNLDEPNHASIMSTIKTFYKIRNPRKIFIVGDFNLKSISWPRSEDMGNGNGTDKLFVDSFNGFGLDQCISGPTHNKGRTLDLMLTNSKTLSQKSTSLQIVIFVSLTIIY